MTKGGTHVQQRRWMCRQCCHGTKASKYSKRYSQSERAQCALFST